MLKKCKIENEFLTTRNTQLEEEKNEIQMYCNNLVKVIEEKDKEIFELKKEKLDMKFNIATLDISIDTQDKPNQVPEQHDSMDHDLLQLFTFTSRNNQMSPMQEESTQSVTVVQPENNRGENANNDDETINDEVVGKFNLQFDNRQRNKQLGKSLNRIFTREMTKGLPRYDFIIDYNKVVSISKNKCITPYLRLVNGKLCIKASRLFELYIKNENIEIPKDTLERRYFMRTAVRYFNSGLKELEKRRKAKGHPTIFTFFKLHDIYVQLNIPL